MIICFEALLANIDEQIQEYRTHPEFQNNKVWQSIVSGLYKAKDIADHQKRRAGYSASIKGMSLDQLKDLRVAINKKVDDIERENKVKIYRLSSDGICSYFFNPSDAKKALIEDLDNQFNDDFHSCDFEIDPIHVPESELGQYISKEECDKHFAKIDREDYQ